MKNQQKSFDGALDASSLRVAIVVSVYHREITKALEGAAVEAIRHSGGSDDNIVFIRVPGAFEIPFAARKAANTRNFDVVVCLGCVIRGETPHFDYIASAVAHGITVAAQETGVPMTFGVLTTNTYLEAKERAVGGSESKGWEAAIAAIHLENAVRDLAKGHDE